MKHIKNVSNRPHPASEESSVSIGETLMLIGNILSIVAQAITQKEDAQ
ncbi:MAG: hypothetical protein ACLFTT_03515 [Candidatus Hydrogenedentota bacterium]